MTVPYTGSVSLHIDLLIYSTFSCVFFHPLPIWWCIYEMYSTFLDLCGSWERTMWLKESLGSPCLMSQGLLWWDGEDDLLHLILIFIVWVKWHVEHKLGFWVSIPGGQECWAPVSHFMSSSRNVYAGLGPSQIRLIDNFLFSIDLHEFHVHIETVP